MEAAENVRGDTNVHVGEEGVSFDVAVLVHHVVGLVHAEFRNCLFLDNIEVDGLILGVILDDLEDGEAGCGEQVSVGVVTGNVSGSVTIIRVHAHTMLLRTLTGGGVDGVRLSDIVGTNENLLALRVGGLNLDDDVSVPHAKVAKHDGKLIGRNDHTGEADIVAE